MEGLWSLTTSNIKKAGQVERARQHLDQAVARLEAAVDKRKKSGESGDRLAEEMEMARSANAAMKKNNDSMSIHLDGAINRLKAVLEN
ncbi:MAG: hypothetical protein CMF63_00885 [Magnetovibrio sp.]|nr:hypothetical protein [Magnetovibrio sp.]